MRVQAKLAICALLLTSPACAGGGLGGVGDVLGGVLGGDAGGTGQAQATEILAEVQSVSTQSLAIEIRTDEGQTGTIEFDENTVVVFQQQQYPVTALERGDIARFQLQQIAQNRYYTGRVDVEQSVQQRNGQASVPSGDVERIYGQVGQIDRQNGFFELRTDQGSYTVVVATSISSTNAQRFSNLRTGDTVTIEGIYSGTTRIDLSRFL